MPTLAVRRRRPLRRLAPRRRLPRHPKARLTAESGLELVLPFAPVEVDTTGVAATFATEDRPGRKPLLYRTGDGLRALSFEVLLGYADHQASAEQLGHRLRDLARRGERVTFAHGRNEAGVWRVTDLRTRTVGRQHGTNAATRLEATVVLTEDSAANVRTGPLTGGATPAPAKPAPPPGAAPTPAAGTHRIAAGDTLYKIAARYYGNGDLWPRIADANRPIDPRRLTIGRVLTIPPRR